MRNDDWMSSVNFVGRPPSFEWYGRAPETRKPAGGPDYNDSPRRIFVDKMTHCIRFENETESQVTIVIEPKETNEAQ